MIKMILKRIFQLIPVLLITMSMTFVITRVLPGNPAVSILGPQATVEDIAKMEEEMGLHDPMPVQYIKRNICKSGTSLYEGIIFSNSSGKSI